MWASSLALSEIARTTVKGHLVDVADLSDAAALHLTGHRAEFLHQPVQLVL